MDKMKRFDRQSILILNEEIDKAIDQVKEALERKKKV